MSNDINIPKVVLKAFPILSDAVFVRQFTLPDTTFDIFVTGSRDFLALVTTDYADPRDQSLELKGISGQYGYEFINLLKPHSKSGETTEILEHDDMEGDFFVTAPYKNYELCYYLANLKIQSESYL